MDRYLFRPGDFQLSFLCCRQKNAVSLAVRRRIGSCGSCDAKPVFTGQDISGTYIRFSPEIQSQGIGFSVKHGTSADAVAVGGLLGIIRCCDGQRYRGPVQRFDGLQVYGIIKKKPSKSQTDTQQYDRYNPQKPAFYCKKKKFCRKNKKSGE